MMILILQVISAISERPSLLNIHSEAIKILLSDRNLESKKPKKVVMGFVPAPKPLDADKEIEIQKATSFLFDCGILNKEDISSGALSYEAKDRFIELYSSYNSDELNEALSSDFLKTLSVAQPTAPSVLNDDNNFQKAFVEASDAAELGRILRMERERLGLSQIDVAKAMGTDHRAVRRIEMGDTNPGWDTVGRYASAIGANIGIMPSQENE